MNFLNCSIRRGQIIRSLRNRTWFPCTKCRRILMGGSTNASKMAELPRWRMDFSFVLVMEMNKKHSIHLARGARRLTLLGKSFAERFRENIVLHALAYRRPI